MSKKQDNLALLLIVALCLHVYAYAAWESWPKVNIYYITMYLVFYVFSIVVYMLSRSHLLSVVSGVTLGVSSYCLYLEFSADPSHWTIVNMISGLLSILTSVITILIIKKLKR